LIHTDVSRDGLGTGVDVTTAQALAKTTGLQVVASGGVNSLEDILQSKSAGLAGIIIGRALYEGLFSLEEALAC
jgi:phosphoribosylformimino-5-aminoimidazole carboxamide ribotide isomerase